MLNCEDLPPFKRAMLLPSRQMLNVGKPLAAGGYNTSSPVLDFKIKGRSAPALLRSSTRGEHGEAAEQLKREQAFMLLFSREQIHPPVYASSIVPAPFGCHGDRLLSLMARGVVMRELLDAPPKSKLGAYTWNPKWQRAALRSLRGCLIRAAELGFCLLDIKPENIVYDVSQAAAYVIDLDPHNVVWMDEDLLTIYGGREDDAPRRGRYDEDYDDWFASYARRQRDDERASYPPVVCARTRGTQLYIMYLLFHCHMHKTLGASPYNGSFGILVLEFLRYALSSSCVPLQTLNDYAQQAHGDFRGELFPILHATVQHYFSKEEASQDPFTWFFLTYPIGEKLLSKLCSGKEAFVTVEGAPFRDDDLSGTGRRAAAVERDDDRPYPCPLSRRSGRRYGIAWNTPYTRDSGLMRAIHPASKIQGL